MPITSIRVHGQQVSPLGDTFISGDSCSGPRHTVHFSALVPVSQISQDIVSGNDRTSSVDPGVNFVSVIATDSLSDAAGDRTRFVVGPTSVSASSPAMRRLAVTGGASCDPRLLTPGFVADGFAASLSERAIDQLIRARGLAPACSLVVCTLRSLKGLTFHEVIDPCKRDAPQSSPGAGSSATRDLASSTRLPANRTPGGYGAHRFSQGDLSASPVFEAVHDTSISKLDSLKIVLRATDPGGFPITYSLQDTLPDRASSTVYSSTSRIVIRSARIRSHSSRRMATCALNPELHNHRK